MKYVPALLTVLAIGTASCLAQLPASPVRPVRAAPAALAAPGTTGQPEADLEKEAEQLKLVNDQLAKAKFELALADPFGTYDDTAYAFVLLRDLADAKAQADAEEDLKVMAHILEKASTSKEERNAHAWGIIYRSPFGSSPALRNLYLEGYGAIFFLNVNYSLTPPPAKAQEIEPKNDRDAEWENAQREIADPHHLESSVKTPASPNSEPDYDAEKVEALQKNLAQALKNATHIRALHPDESVTIVVSARNPSGPARLPTRVFRRAGPGSAAELAPHRPRLTMRAKKSDIEALQKEKISLEEFRKKMTVSLG